jgi:hypothetical protein
MAQDNPIGHRNARERGLEPGDVDAEVSAARAEHSRWVLRITSDTNVIVSALNFPGNPSRILDLAEAGEIRLAVSDEILNEVNRVLLRPKFGWAGLPSSKVPVPSVSRRGERQQVYSVSTL